MKKFTLFYDSIVRLKMSDKKAVRFGCNRFIKKSFLGKHLSNIFSNEYDETMARAKDSSRTWIELYHLLFDTFEFFLPRAIAIYVN